MVDISYLEEEGSEEIWKRYLPDFLSGETVLLVAVGDVQAGVNLDQMGEGDVRVEEDMVTIDLPEAHILSAGLNEDETKLYDRDRGLIDLQGDDALIEEARRDAVDEISCLLHRAGSPPPKRQPSPVGSLVPRFLISKSLP